MDSRVALSKRELEVAELVAQGLTNRQIAQRLFIAERTAEGHVERIRNKLEFSSRAQIAAWFAASAASDHAVETAPTSVSGAGGIVAFLLTDLEGSSRAWEARPAAMRESMAQHDAIVSGCIERHGGRLVEAGREGDSVLGAFQNVPAAARAALDIQREISEASWPDDFRPRIRIAIHAGEAQFRGGHYYGHALNRCARLLGICHPGQVVMTQAAEELLADEVPAESELWDLGQHRLKDLTRPEHVFQLADLKHPVQFPPLQSVPDKRTNLPIQVTTFVDRQQDLRQLNELETEARLVTLVGPGGCGKTRLAQEFAAQLIGDQHPDGVWFADLTPVADAHLVPHAVAASLGLLEQAGRAPLQTVIEHCRQRNLVLVLDNCEHLAEASARLAHELISSAAELRIIATSREPLKVPGEIVWRVSPLPVPEATRLFMDRAHLRAPKFELGESSLAVVTRISERLDGIPLAMELAAARVPMMPVDEILDRLERGTAFLAGGTRTSGARQQTLKATMDWSHSLLEPAEKILFRRLAVFPGSFSLPAAEQICGDEDLPPETIVELLGQLVDKSLVQAVNGRYRMLATIRAYALERLQVDGNIKKIQGRHADFCLRLAASRRPGELALWLDRLEDEHASVVAAVQWATKSDPELGARLAGKLYFFWLLRGHITEARQSLDQLLERLDEDHPRRGSILLESGAFAYVAGDFETAQQRLDAGLVLCRAAGNRVALARGLFYLGVLDSARDRLDLAERSLQEALKLSLEVDVTQHQAEVLHQLGMVASLRGQNDEARSLFQQSIDIRRTAGRHDEAGMTLVFLSAVSFLLGELAAAKEAIREALETGLALRDRRSAWSLDVLACMAAGDGNFERALTLAGAASAMFDSTGQKPPAGWYQFTSLYLDNARRALGPDAVRKAWEAGRALTFEEALGYALEEDAREASTR